MITINLTIAIAGFLSVCFLLVFGRWVFYNLSTDQNRFEDLEKKILQCPYCTHLFPKIDDGMLRCPNCKSILDAAENQIGDSDAQ